VSMPSTLDTNATAFASEAEQACAGATVQFHKLSAAASRVELAKCGEVLSSKLKENAEKHAAAAGPSTVYQHAFALPPPPPQLALGAFAAVCNGRAVQVDPG